MTMSQPMAMTAIVGRRASGRTTTATRTGGSHATNGPKNGMAMRTPAAAAVTAR